MTTVFADTFFWLALVHPKDAWHVRARAFLETFAGGLLTTEWVMMEVGDALAGSAEGRTEFISLYDDWRNDPDIRVIHSNTVLLHEALELYKTRPDKHWSLTDCTSFIVMRKEAIAEALTGDHHFEQAGFVALLK